MDQDSLQALLSDLPLGSVRYFATVGSTNLDWRSLLYNDEANAMVIGTDFANQMEAMFQRDLGESAHITKADWNKRPMADRIKEKAARMWERWL